MYADEITQLQEHFAHGLVALHYVVQACDDRTLLLHNQLPIFHLVGGVGFAFGRIKICTTSAPIPYISPVSSYRLCELICGIDYD